MKTALITIPTYNERGNITEMVERLFGLMDGKTDYVIKLLVIDDRSPDGTGEEVRRLQKHHKNLYLIEGKKNGLGSAYRRGFDYAFKNLRFDVVVMMDADFSHDPSDVVKLLRAIDDGNDIAVGSRYTAGGLIPGNWPIVRILNTRVAHFVSRYIGGIHTELQELTGGFKAMRRSALAKIPYREARASGFGIQLFLSNEFVKQDFRVAEVPICFRERKAGASKMRAKDITEFISIAHSLNRTSPFKTHLYYASAALIGAVSALTMFNIAEGFSRLGLGTSLLASLNIIALATFAVYWYRYRSVKNAQAEDEEN